MASEASVSKQTDCDGHSQTLRDSLPLKHQATGHSKQHLPEVSPAAVVLHG